MTARLAIPWSMFVCGFLFRQEVVQFMKRWRHKRFCTCDYIRRCLKLRVDRKTIANVLVWHHFRWQRLPRVRGLSPAELKKREEFCGKYGDKTPAWWQENIQLVLDGVIWKVAYGKNPFCCWDPRHGFLHVRLPPHELYRARRGFVS